MKKRFSLRSILFLSILVFYSCDTKNSSVADIPVAWSTYKSVDGMENDFKDLIAHGVGLVNMNARNVADAEEKLEVARRIGMKYHIVLPDITENIQIVRKEGLDPVYAVMIGGVYQGRAIDRHLFTFSAQKHDIVIETPVYNKGFAYTSKNDSNESSEGEPFGHYFPDMPDPIKAEIVVPLSDYDGKQHLEIIHAEISTAEPGTKLEFDSVDPEMPASSEIENRKLYKISFNLEGFEEALLDKIGIAVYWQYEGYAKHWIFGNGIASAAAESTREALKKEVQRIINIWTEANGGDFPSDVVLAARFGDECFYPTGHSQSSNAMAVSYPLWDYSAPAIEIFKEYSADREYPRTWGFPEIYGENAYGWWMYTMHKSTADLVNVIKEEIIEKAPELLLFRNTTRMGVFDLSNDHDGSGQELLTRNLDIVHIDPYPVSNKGYSNAIPRDMSYSAGLSRRYNKLLIPWMQAHVYSNLLNVTPEQVERMADEQWSHGVDAVMWLGYGYTFPDKKPESWEQAAAFHEKLSDSLPPKPQAKLAVLRSYNAMAASSLFENTKLRNPSDWMLQQFLEVWAVKHKNAYDVFELPPVLSATEQKDLENDLKDYDFIVSTVPWKNAVEIGLNTMGQVIDLDAADRVMKDFEEEINKLGWLDQK